MMTPSPDLTDKLNSAVRHCYSGYTYLSEPELKQRLKEFLAGCIARLAKDGISEPQIRDAVLQSFGCGLTGTYAAVTPIASSLQQNSGFPPLTSLPQLLYAHEWELPSAEQTRILRERIQKAASVAADSGLNLVDLLTHLDILLSARNNAFEDALTHSFWKIIYHLNPREAAKLGVPRPNDLRVDTRRDPQRMERLVDYIRCGRLARDTARTYRHELQNTVFNPS